MNTKVQHTHIKLALLIRKVEETLLRLYSQGKLNGTVHTCVGQEFSAVSIATCIDPDDFIVSNHRGHGHYIARTGDVVGLLAEVMGKKSGVAGGVGGSQHLCNANYISNGIQGGMTPIATGVALGFKLQKKGNIVIAFIGDGTMGEGILYEALNFSSIWSCPVLFVLENNQYAQSTSIKQTLAGSIRERVRGFNVEYFNSSTADVNDLLSTSEDAVNYVRKNSKPAFLEILTQRLNSHSKSDDNRSDEEIENYRQNDFLINFSKKNQSEYQILENEVNNMIAAAEREAELGEDLINYPNDNFIKHERISTIDIRENDKKRINELIYEALKDELQANPLSSLIGEDIEFNNIHTPKPYGGAFKVTKDLNILFPQRVRNTPISEAAIVGVSTGLSIAGYRAIAEIMFGDFTTLILDQLVQHACKFQRMFNGAVNIPIVVRTPMGGKRGYGPTHSQSIEKFFFGIPDLNVFALNHRINPKLIYKNIFSKINTPSFVVENKVLYTRLLSDNDIEGFSIKQTTEDFPTVLITPEGKKSDITIFCYGGILEDVEKAVMLAFDEEDILCDIIAPTYICPINIFSLVQSVAITRRLLIVEEGSNFAALGSEIITALCERGIKLEKVQRLSNNNIIPCSFKAENNLIPNSDSIFQAIRTIYNE
jgi:2-oxoisovalerate dehydrogenase E1 component